MSMLNLRRSQKQSGFTLMELLIVIAVLGLLLGMLIPRLAGITDDTVDTVCDTNNKGIRYYTQAYVNKTGSLPGGLTNLVDYANSGGTYTYMTDPDGTAGPASPAYLPSFQDDNDASDAAEVLAEEFYTRNHPNAYMLDEDEVAELKAMGISTVYNYFGTISTTDTDRTMHKTVLAEGDYVMMMGLSASAVDTPAIGIDAAVGGTTALSATSNIGNPLWIGRIMMAVNDQCDLVKGGYIQASALCPGAVLAEDSFSHKEYIIVLPRLEATVAKCDTASLITEDAAIAFKDAASDGTRVIEDTFSAQAAWEFDMSCPEGHKWPDNDEDTWVEYTPVGNETDGYDYTSIF